MFDRAAAYGMRLDIRQDGGAVRPQEGLRLPGRDRRRRCASSRGRRGRCELVALVGDRKVFGFTGRGNGGNEVKITRQAYAEMYGPTVGDRVRLADTELWIEVEKDTPPTARR